LSVRKLYNWKNTAPELEKNLRNLPQMNFFEVPSGPNF
jgi:hypothetical protein